MRTHLKLIIILLVYSNCRRLNTIEEGQYGVVHRAKDKTSGEVVALKKIKIERLGFPVTSLREINILLNMYHPNVVNLKEIVVGKKINK